MSVKAFTIRLPEALVKQIDARCEVNRRTRNQEVTFLLERAIDNAVNKDRELLNRLKASGPQTP